MSSVIVEHPSALDDVQRGELLQFNRDGGFDHWAVYMGSRQVCHFTVDTDLFGLVANGLKSGKGEVSVQPYEEVAGDSVVYVNCINDTKWTPYSPREIVRRAGSRCGENLYYHLTDYNCEHFVNWCRYGVNYSKQVQSMRAGTSAGVLTGLTMSSVLGPVGAAAYGSFTAYQVFKGSQRTQKGGDSCNIQ